MADGNKPELLTTSEDVVDDILTSAGMEVNVADVTAGESTMEHSQTAEPLQVHAADAFAPRAVCDENELLRQLTKEKERLEQIAFIRDQELSEVKQRLADVSTQSSQLSEELSLSRGDLLEKERKFRLMETARDDMALKKIQHEEEAIKYKMQKEERDDLVQRITREKLLLTEEVVTLKEKMKEIALEKAQLVGEKKSWEREKREKDFEVQRTRDEAAVLEESKKWLLKEIAERDNRVSQMRIESSNKDVVWQNEKNRLYMQKDELNDKVIELDAELTKTKKELDEKIKTFTKELETKRKQVEEAEGEMRVHEQIAREYKSALADANQAIEEQKLAYEQNQTTVFEVQQAMGSLHAEMATKEDEMERELKDKESRILELEEELDKANELLKSRHNLGAMSDEDLAKVAPAAAETSRLLRSGMTLSQLYREHARVVGELEEQRILNKQLEAELREVVEEIEHHAPSLSRQKEQLDKTLEHNDRLVAQLEKASEDRAALVNEKDSAKRELAFTRVELEKFQREHTKLREQTAQLLFVIESEQRNRTGQPPIGGDEQKRMYTSIVGLQQRIVQLELDLENSNKQVQSAVAEAVQVESARLREELDLANHELEALRTAMGRLQTAISSVEQQRDRLRDIVDRGSLDPEAASLRCENSDLKNELNALRARAVVQEERINNMQQEQKKLHQISEDRLAQQRMVETELTQAKLAISAELQLQKQVAAETKKELDKFVQTFHKQTEELQKARSKTVEAEQRLCTSNETLLQQQDRIAHLQIECRSLREDLERARSSMARTEGELKVHQDMARTHQTLIAALGDAERRLQLNEDMKVARLESVLESTVIERDQLRLAKQNLEEQVSNASRMSGQAEARLTGERDLARTQLSEARDQLRSIEVEVSELRTRLSAAQQQAAKVDSSHGMNPERLANRNTYLEAQVEEMRAKLSETEAKLLRSQQEVAQLASTSSSVESSLKQHTENAQETIGRLNSLLKAGEQRQVELTSDLNALRDELQRQIEVIAAKESEWGTNRAQLEQKIAVFEVKLADANALHVDTERRLEETRVESTEYRNKVSEMEARLTSLLAEKESLDVIVESVRGQLTLVQTDLQASEARVSEEVRNRESALDAEKHRMAEMEQKVQLGEEALRAANQRAEELIVHISKLSNELSVREAAAASSSTDLGEESIQAMHHVLRFLREEKDKAQERAMQAEVEMKRLAAEAESMRDDRDRMAQAVRAREQEAEQNRAALAQRSELLARLESMSTVQKENAILKSERERLAKVLSETDARRINLERALGEMRTARSSAEQRAASATSLADARARELDAVRQRAGETAQERIAKMQQDVNEARERAEKAAADRDAEVRKAQAAEQSLVEAQNAAKQSEMKLKDVETRFVQIKNLALKYRTESAKLKEENEKLNAAVAAGAAHPAATDVAAASVNEAAVQESQRLHSEIEELRKQYEADKAELQGQIDQFESEKTEFAMRSQAMDNLLKSTKSRLEATVKDLEGEKEAHARTRVQLSAVVRQVAAASQPEMPPAAPTASSTTPSTASVQAARAPPPLPTPSPAPLSSTASSSFTPSVPTPSLTSVTSSAVSTTAIASASLEVAPTLPTLPTSSTAPSEPGPPVPKPSIFSFNPNASSFQSSFHGSIFGTSASRPISTMSSSSSSSVTVAAPQSTSPAPSVPQMNTESGVVASFFGRRPTEPLLPRSPVCSSSSSAAPADPSPAPLQHTPLHIQQRNTTTAPATPSVPERSTSPVEPLVGTPTTSNLRSSSVLFGTSATSIPRLLVLENEPISSVPIQQQPDSGEEQAGSSVMIRDEDSASGAEVSQDGLPSAITSSSGEVVGRKRTASSMSSSGHQDAKRQRESPGDEQISSSERNHEDNLLDEESRDAEPIIVGMDEDDEENAEDSLGVIDDGEELPEMNEGAEIQQDHEEAPQEDDDDVQVVSSDSDDNAVESDFDEGNYRHEIPANVQEGVEDDYGMDEEEEEYGDEEEEEEMYDEEPEEEEDMEEDVGERDAQMRDAEVHDEEPQLADQSEHDDGGDADEQTQDAENAELVGVGEEREAASAVEEADDEGRDAPSDSQQRTPMHGGEEESENFAQPSQSSSAQKPRREPITYDVATSSNERSGEEAQPSSSGVQQNVRRAPRQLYAAPGIREGPSPPLGARPPGGVPRGGRSGGRHTTMSRRGGGRTMRR